MKYWLRSGLPLVVLLVGCSSVVTRYPLAYPDDIQSKTRIDGIWLADDGPLFIRFDPSGMAHMATLEWKETHFELIQGEMTVVDIGERHFLSARFPDGERWNGAYYLVEFGVDTEGFLLLWEPIVKQFEKALAQKHVPGFAEAGKYGTQAVLTAKPNELVAFLTNWKGEALFNYSKPMVLRKLK